MRNGYTIIYDSDTIKHHPGSFHSKAVQHYFGETPTNLMNKYGMKFGGFSVKTPLHISNRHRGHPGFNSGTFNAAFGNGVGWSDGQREMNAYEAALIFMLVEEWKENGPATTVVYDQAAKFLKTNCQEIFSAMHTMRVTSFMNDWAREYCAPDCFPNCVYRMDYPICGGNRWTNCRQ